MCDEEIHFKELNELLGDFSGQLDKIAVQVFHVEEAIAGVLSDGRTTDFSVITKLQSLDYIRQSLEDLALLSYLLKKQGIKAKIDVQGLVSKLKLEETTRLLEGNRPHQANGPSFGEIDLF